MEISKKELRKISRNFRQKVNRAMQAHYEESISIIKMLVNYIDQTDLIYDYIMSVTTKEYAIEEDIGYVEVSPNRRILSTGSTPEEEVGYTYQLLKYICENDLDFRHLGWGYISSNKYQDMTKAFGERIILPFANQINSYMMDIATDMGYDEEGKFMITVNGGQAQVNIANDSSTITATQNNGIAHNEIQDIITSIKNSLPTDIDKETQELIEENSQLILEETSKSEPKRQVIKSLYRGLKFAVKSVPQAVTLMEGVTKLGELVQPFL